MLQPFWKIAWKFLKKVKLLFNPETPLGIQKENENMSTQKTCTQIHVAALLLRAKKLETNPAVHQLVNR